MPSIPGRSYFVFEDIAATHKFVVYSGTERFNFLLVSFYKGFNGHDMGLVQFRQSFTYSNLPCSLNHIQIRILGKIKNVLH